jgi:uncharacterized protein (DUF1919 family)
MNKPSKHTGPDCFFVFYGWLYNRPLLANLRIFLKSYSNYIKNLHLSIDNPFILDGSSGVYEAGCPAGRLRNALDVFNLRYFCIGR